MRFINSKAFAIAFQSLMVFTLISCGCSAAKESQSASDGSSAETVYQGNHRMEAVETDAYLLQDGVTDYKILVPEEMSSNLLYAESELTKFFLEATGVSLGSATATGKSYSPSDHYISLGQNEYFRSAALGEDTAAMKRDAARIVTKGQSIFIFGSGDIGALYGVYDFLSIHFHFETYYSDAYEIDTGVHEVKLMNYDVFDEPDIDYRQRRGLLYPSSSDSDDSMFAYRSRCLDEYGSMFLPIHMGDSASTEASVTHNSWYYFPTAKYLESHPKFYSNDQKQLCFTAHGDAEELDLMVEIAAGKIEQSLKWYPAAEYPQYTTAFLGMNDTYYLCDCEACTAISAEHNDAIVSTEIIFMKRVGKKVNAWMDLAENADYKRDLTYSFFAYQSAAKPPFTQNADGTLSYKEDIAPEDGVNLTPYCAFMNFDYGKSFYASENDEGREYIEMWGTLYKGSWGWTYGGFFNDYISFYDTYSFYQDYHAYLAKYGFKFSFEQVHNDQRGADPGFGSVTSYILTKKAWDSSLDVSTLIDNYFRVVFGEAAAPMKELFQKLRLWFAKTTGQEGWGRSSIQLSVTSNKKYWTIGFVKEMFSYLDEAYAKIETYRKDDLLYTKMKRHIDCEWLFPAKVAIGCYEDEYGPEEFKSIKSRFKAIAQDLNLKDIKEFVSINSFLESLDD